MWKSQNNKNSSAVVCPNAAGLYWPPMSC